MIKKAIKNECVLPKEIKICGMDYTVSTQSNLARDICDLGHSCLSGLFITIDNSVPTQVQLSTFMHEIIEQINSVHELDLNHPMICTISQALYQVLVENNIDWKQT